MDVRDEEILALSWDNYAKQFHDKLSQLWHKEKYTDATITCEGKFYSVHKIVLSTCSQFFERVFEHTDGKHPVVVLPDVKQHEIEALLKFMYDGVLQIARKDLPRLMKVADLLKIRSFCGPEEWTSDEVVTRDNHANSVDKLIPPKTSRPFEYSGAPSCNKRRKQEDERVTTTYATQTFMHHPHTYEVHKTQDHSGYQTATLRIPGESVPVNELARELPHDNLGSLKSIATSVMGFETDRHYHHDASLGKDKSEVTIKNEYMDDVSKSQNAALGAKVDNNQRGGTGSGNAFLHHQPDLTELSQAEAVHPLSDDIAGPSGVHEDVQLQAAVEVVMGVAEGEEEETLYTHSPQSVKWETENTTTTTTTTTTPSKPSKKNQSRQGTVNYSCPFCNKLFLDKFKCSRHMYAHTGEKPFICTICARRFSRKDNLQKHMKDKHKLFKGQF